MHPAPVEAASDFHTFRGPLRHRAQLHVWTVPSTTLLMSDLIYLAVIVAFFAAAELYARWCEKL